MFRNSEFSSQITLTANQTRDLNGLNATAIGYSKCVVSGSMSFVFIYAHTQTQTQTHTQYKTNIQKTNEN